MSALELEFSVIQDKSGFVSIVLTVVRLRRRVCHVIDFLLEYVYILHRLDSEVNL